MIIHAARLTCVGAITPGASPRSPKPQYSSFAIPKISDS